MTIYNLRLSDRVGSSLPAFWGEGTAYVVGIEVKALFDEVCASPLTAYTASDYWWNSAAGDVRAGEVLIYFLAERGDSLVRKVQAGAGLGAGGTTLIRTAGNVSEVYVKEALAAMGGGASIARGLAVLAFHEAMHNKLRRGNSLHATGGGGIAATTVYADTELTQRNIDLMAGALATAVAQDTGFL
jgi:hypothetical protein